MASVKQTRLQAVGIIIAFAMIALLLLYFYNLHFKEQEYETQLKTNHDVNACDRLKGPVFPPPPRIPPFTWENTGLITLWFDDAWDTQFKVAFPLMEKEHFTGALSIPTKFICNKGAMTWNELRILQNNGWETTAHTISHQCDLKYYNTLEIITHELLGSKQILIGHGLRADQFVMPCGYGGEYISTMFINEYPPIVETAEKYFSSYRTTNDVRINALPILDPYNLNAFQIRRKTTDSEIANQIEAAKLEKGWLILVFHQIEDSDMPLGITRDQFIKVLQMVKQSGLPVVLPSQVLAIKKKT